VNTQTCANRQQQQQEEQGGARWRADETMQQMQHATAKSAAFRTMPMLLSLLLLLAGTLLTQVCTAHAE
jgi:hypothetical protein